VKIATKILAFCKTMPYAPGARKRRQEPTVNERQTMNTIAFNTGRTYTECGQRIAARRIESGAVVMIDIDRQIDYLLPSDIELTQRGVMRAYDSNANIYPSDVDLSYSDYYETVNALRQLAAEVNCI
jgi:hypothetical protein